MVIETDANGTRTLRAGSGLLELGRAFEAWSDPSPYEPTYGELASSGESDDLEDALDMRTFAL